LQLATEERAEQIVALDEALTLLAGVDPRLVQVIEYRFFAGLTDEETAAVLRVSSRTVRRDWLKARAWLQRALSDSDP
jgi:RNA polymerase sigma factor (sigma-70 family)